jgi:iron-sulfur cluster repair protein YtfE (RIC family)
MNAEFLAALKTVEQDHQLVLDKMQALKETISHLLDPGQAAPRRAVRRLREMNDYFIIQFTAHMDEEEITLFPFLKKYKPDPAELVAQLRAEHDDIRRKCDELGKCLDVADQLQDAIPRMVLRDLLAYGWDLCEVLDYHAHLETRALHRCLARSLPESEAAGP